MDNLLNSEDTERQREYNLTYHLQQISRHLINFFKLHLFMHLYVCISGCHTGAGSLLDSGGQEQQEAPLPTKPYCWPLSCPLFHCLCDTEQSATTF